MSEMSLDLSGKVALITGGSRGLGKAIALSMAKNGAEVAICGRKQENLDKAVADFRQTGLDVMARVANVGKSDQVADLFQALEERFGKLDILANNVGMNILTPAVTIAPAQSHTSSPITISSYSSSCSIIGLPGRIPWRLA